MLLLIPPFLSLFIICLVLVAISLFFICIKIIFKKGGKFPTGHVSDSKELTEQGITCAQSQDRDAQAGA